MGKTQLLYNFCENFAYPILVLCDRNLNCKSEILQMGFTKYFHSGRIIVYDNFKLALCLQSKVATTSILQMFLNLLPEEFMYLRNDIESLHREMGQQFSLQKSERYYYEIMHT